MSSIRKRPDGVWRARYRDDAGKEHARHFARKVDAQRWLDEVTTATNTGMYVDPKRTRTLFGVVADGWLTTGAVSWKATTKATNAGILRVHVLPRWGQVPVGRIEHDAVQTWVAGMVEAGMKPRT